MTSKNKYWFRGKRYGWGWYPVTWQGWAVLSIFVAVLILESSFVHLINSWLFGTIVAITVLLLLLICYKKGEKPRWRWGK